MEDLNVVNDTQELNVEAHDPVETTGASAATAEVDAPKLEQSQGIAEPAPPQTVEDNAIYATVRKEAERSTREAVASELSDRLTAYGYINPYKDNKPVRTLAEFDELHADMAIADEATKRGVSFDQQRDLVDSIRKQVKETDPEFVQLREQLEQAKVQEAKLHCSADLDKIRVHNPRETAKTIEELGNDFLVIMAAQENRGETPDPIRAYEMVRAANALKAPPPSMGDIKQSDQSHTENRYANMSQADFDKAVLAAERGELRKG